MEPNQRRVESSCPNLQVTPRGGGGGGGGRRQKQQRLQRPEPAAAGIASGRTGGELGGSSSASGSRASAASGWLGRSEGAGGRCFLGSVLGNPVAGWARGSPRECGPAPPPLNAGGVRGSGRCGGGGSGGGRSGESMPPALRFAQAALAARAPVAQDETRLHAARLGSQPDAVAPAVSALVASGHARPLQVIPRHQFSPPARSRAPTPLRAGFCFPGSPGSDSCDWLLAHRLLAKRLLEGEVGLGVLEKDT